MVEEEAIVLGDKTISKFLFFKMSNERTIIPLGDLFYLDIRPVNEKFNTILLCTKGKGNPAKFKCYSRPRIQKVVKKEYKLRGKDLLGSELPKEGQQSLDI